MLTLRPFAFPDWRAYRGWFADPEIASRFDCPDEAWLARLSQASSSACWTANDPRGGLVAVLHAEWDGARRLFVSIAVDPARRGQGLGTLAARRFVEEHGRRFSAIEAHTDPENAPCVALARRCGFRLLGDGPDEDGRLRFELEPKPARAG